jgi:nuclear GTP-binding protein
MIDCPGIVPPSAGESDEVLLMRGVVRVENVANPAQYVDGVLKRCQRRHIERTYGVKEWKNAEEFLESLARKSGRLLKGGEPDCDAVARVVLNNFLRGRVPWFTPPPMPEGGEEGEKRGDGVGEREGRLGEMGRKRKREEIEAMVKKAKMGNETKGAVNAEATDEFEEEELDEEDRNEDAEDGSASDNDEDGLEDEFDGFVDGLAVDPDTIGDLDGGSDVDFGEEFEEDEEDRQTGSVDDNGCVTLEESEEEQTANYDDLKVITSRSIDERKPPGKKRRKS